MQICEIWLIIYIFNFLSYGHDPYHSLKIYMYYTFSIFMPAIFHTIPIPSVLEKINDYDQFIKTVLNKLHILGTTFIPRIPRCCRELQGAEAQGLKSEKNGKRHQGFSSIQTNS